MHSLSLRSTKMTVCQRTLDKEKRISHKIQDIISYNLLYKIQSPSSSSSYSKSLDFKIQLNWIQQQNPIESQFLFRRPAVDVLSLAVSLSTPPLPIHQSQQTSRQFDRKQSTEYLPTCSLCSNLQNIRGRFLSSQ